MREWAGQDDRVKDIGGTIGRRPREGRGEAIRPTTRTAAVGKRPKPRTPRGHPGNPKPTPAPEKVPLYHAMPLTLAHVVTLSGGHC